jgi:hypothetical protein
MSFRASLASLAVLAALTAPAGAVNLVSNPGFETGDFTGWTVTGDGILIDSSYPNTGNYDAAFGAPSNDPNPGVLSQSLATTPGQSYQLSFALMDEAGVFGDSFTVSFGGFSQTIAGYQAPPFSGNLPSGYTSFTFRTLGADVSGASTTLSFTGVNNTAAWNLDDVSVSAAVPEPSTWALLLIAFAGFGARRSFRIGAGAAA